MAQKKHYPSTLTAEVALNGEKSQKNPQGGAKTLNKQQRQKIQRQDQ